MRVSFLALLLPLACTGTADDKTDDTAADTDTDTDADTDTDTDTDTDPDAPSAPVVAITPAAPAPGVDLTVTVLKEAVDPQGDAVTYSYAWSEDGALRADLVDTVVPGAETADGEVWSVAVTPTDGAHVGPAGTAEVTIGNLAPSAPTLSFSPAAPVAGETITLVFDPPAVDPEGDPLTTSVTWYDDGALANGFADWTEIDGRYVDGGETFRAVVEVTDGYHDPVVAEASVTVANNVPVVDTPDVSPYFPSDEEDLVVVVHASDEDGSDLTYTYTWYRDGVIATDVGDTTTVLAEYTTVGEEWYCEVAVSDGSDTVSATSNSVRIIPWEGYLYVYAFAMVIPPDGASGSGTWAHSILTHGSREGENDCALVWDAVGVDNASCPGCTYTFDVAYTYDATASDAGTGTDCAGYAVDGTGEMTWRESLERFAVSFEESTGYYSTSLNFTGDGGVYRYSYYEDYATYHTIDVTTDTAGYTTVTGYDYVHSYQ